MNLIGPARLGREMECRHTQSGKRVGSFPVAFDYGMKGQDGKRPSQWVEVTLWGDQVDALAPYLLKGAAVHLLLRDVHVETYEGKNGFGAKLVGTAMDIKLIGGKSEGGAAPAQAARREPAAQPPREQQFDDDIPF